MTGERPIARLNLPSPRVRIGCAYLQECYCSNYLSSLCGFGSRLRWRRVAQRHWPGGGASNLEAGGYEVGEDITKGANLSLPPEGKIDAEVYLGVESGPEQEPGLTAGVYFFADPADAEAVAAAFSDSLHEIRDTRLYNIAGDDENVLKALVETGEGG